MAKFEITAEQEQLARFAKAMGHPTRIAVLQKRIELLVNTIFLPAMFAIRQITI